MDAWILSLFLLSVSTGLDCGSSWRQPEANPLVATRGYFGVRGVAIKTGAVGFTAVAQSKTSRHRKLHIIVNVAASGVLIWATQSNLRK